MQLSYHADYACRVLIYLAVAESDRSSIADIATAYKISENHLVKVVHRLGKLGYVETIRGRGGGIKLAKEPNAVNIGTVIRDMEPNFTVVECFSPSTNTCPIAGACGLKTALAAAMTAFLQTLDSYSLDDVLRNKRALKQILG